MVNNELYHYGVLGMKWGVRRNRKSSSSGTKRNRGPHEDYVKAHSKKSVKKMSNSELKEANNRLQMEKQYSQLTKKEVSAGRKFVTNVLLTSATAVATGYATKYMKTGVQAVGKILKS